MSTRIIRASTGVTIASNAGIPCLGCASDTPSSRYGQSGVQMNETIQIIFEGTPPFDLAPVVTNFVNGNRTDQGCYCGFTNMTLTTNTFDWTVSSFANPYSNTSSAVRQDPSLFTGNRTDAIIWIATEKNPSGSQRNYYPSPNFTLSTTSYDRPASAAPTSKALSLSGWGILGLAFTVAVVGL